MTSHTDLHLRLEALEARDLLRLLTCGSVDDGKSTLIGRLLHDAGAIPEDQLAALNQASARYGTTGDAPDLALLVDGLEAEREQGITIDVAYRYFATEKRKFIIADTPGHEQYTRNMATGASTADVAIILVDASKGLLPQTRRHSAICALLGIRSVVLAVNKMDRVDWDEATFRAIENDYQVLAERLGLERVDCIPLSALQGRNVVHSADDVAPWHAGPTLLQWLESVAPAVDQRPLEAVRLPIQYVSRPHAGFRGYAGTLATGTLYPGQAVRVLPSGQRSRIHSLAGFSCPVSSAAHAGQAVTVTLADELDVSRGDWLVDADTPSLTNARALAAELIWMHERPLRPGQQFWLKLATCSVPATVSRLTHSLDIHRLERGEAPGQLALNSIGGVEITLGAPLPCEPYAACADAGAFILVDRSHHGTVAAGMIDRVHESTAAAPVPDARARARQKGQQALAVWVYGGAEATRGATVRRLEGNLFAQGLHVYRLPEPLPDGIHDPEAVIPLLLDAGLVVLAGADHPPAVGDAQTWIISQSAGDPETTAAEMTGAVVARQPDHR
ncbi:bifunctional enzyme CysN/CysC/sulfate adenylyltransferase subunit 1 [Alkalispirillum mobile]|uniref:sulfate adenylyltransferase n=1 Tax=Alkalispirillum mobile TaxID=85925 RepID=A0A498C659_9GAMM|nr:GTP-binding protein [Alkalispirillum mobile]RLK50517.1 bifunctional enzyme CysN/CysC/sulfate adenylyltransferase subunit 1 [Alkalispirillum mobile]